MVTALYTVKEVAERLKLSERTIERYIADGDLKCKKIGGLGQKSSKPRNVRITEEQLEEFIRFGPQRDLP